MAMRLEQLFPAWLTSNFVFFPPVVFFLSLMFAFGVFFQIDHRLMLILSFADYLLYFALFFSVVVILLVAVSGFVMWLNVDWNAFFQRHERKLRILMIVVVTTAGAVSQFIGPFFSSLIGILAALFIIAAFVAPATMNYARGDMRRFRITILFLLFGSSWLVQALGQLVGTSVVSGPKRVYQLKLTDASIVYANIFFYTSSGIIYRADGAVYFSPNDAIIFTKRTAQRSAM